MNTKILMTLLIGMLVGGTIVYLIKPLPQNASDTKESQLYSCGMHPQVISEEPDDCPICGMKLTPIKGDAKQTIEADEEREILYWRAPMDPTEIYEKPGKSKMGMDLVPVYEGEEAGGAGSITIDGTVQQNMNLRLGSVTRKDLSREIRAYGTVTYAQDKQFSVNTKINGWIEKLHVNTVGRSVRKGEPLLQIYSPELLSTQEEYLVALKNLENLSASTNERIRRGAEQLLESARKRLDLWDIPSDQIGELKETGQVEKTLLLRAPVSGVVTHKAVVEGDKVTPAKDLFHIANLEQVWIEATVYETEIPLIHVGQTAKLDLDYFPGKEIRGKVDFIYPYLDKKSRSARVRLVFENQDQMLKPEMYTTVRIQSQIAENALAIPSEAILRSGERNIVFISRENGKFEPREIKIGFESSDGYTQVLSGLLEEERVVTSGQFLLDSESRTREAIAKMRAETQTTIEQKEK